MYDGSRSLCTLVALVVISVLSLTGCRSASEKDTLSLREMDSPAVPLSVLSPLPAPNALTSPLASFADASVLTGRVLYHSDLAELYQIYLVDNGKPAVALTQAPSSAVEPAWSPDGRTIAFAVYAADSTDAEIYTMRADGSDRHKVMSTQDRLNWRPDWSPNGTQLVFQSNRDGNFEIYRVNIDGTSLTNLTNHAANDGDPDWSPDGSKILFVSDRGGSNAMFIMDEDGSNVTQLLEESWECSFPRWSQNGDQIAFASTQDGTLDIYVMSADGSNVRQVTIRPGDNTMPAWVGNDRLLFTGEIGDLSWDLFLVDIDGSSLVQLTNTAESERYPAWAP